MIRKLLSALPQRLGHSIYHRVLRRHPQYFQNLFINAPLREFPETTMDLKPTDVAHGEIALFGYYESHLSEALVDLARKSGGTLLDVGANYGYFSLLWCAASPDNRAIAVEASPDNVVALRKNIARNSLESRIQVFEFAATNHNGILSFDLGPEQQTGWGGIVNSPTPCSVTVQARRLDQLLGEHEFTAAKIDCEGADALVLEGLSGLLISRRIAHLFFEKNPFRMSGLNVDDLNALTLLKTCGYSVEIFGRPSDNDDVVEYHARALPRGEH